MRARSETAKGAEFIAALTATNQLGSATCATTRKEDNRQQMIAMRRLGFLAEAAHLRACAAYQDELVFCYETGTVEQADQTIRRELCDALVNAIDRYIAFPARTKTQSIDRLANVLRWQRGPFIALHDWRTVDGWYLWHDKRWTEELKAEYETFERRQAGEVL